jgi:copper(I)-binding protein
LIDLPRQAQRARAAQSPLHSRRNSGRVPAAQHALPCPAKGPAMRILTSIAVATALIVSAGVALAHEFKVGDLEIVHPWAPVPLKGADVTGGYVKIINHGTTPDRLLKVSVEFAKTAQIHSMKMDGDVMKMEEMKDGLEIPAGATVELKPKSFHIMFMGVNQPLAPEEMMDAELTFEKAGTVKVEFMIEPAGTAHSMDDM